MSKSDRDAWLSKHYGWLT